MREDQVHNTVLVSSSGTSYHELDKRVRRGLPLLWSYLNCPMRVGWWTLVDV